jgi:predicted PurR-regulated permease PerM
MKTFTINELIRIIVILLLLLWGFFLIKPFIAVLAWAIILAVALFPLYTKVGGIFGKKHQKKVQTLFSILLIALLVIPTYSSISSLFGSVSKTLNAVQNNELKITPPTDQVKEWPIMGERIYSDWKALSENSKQYAIDHKDFLIEKGGVLARNFTGILGTVLAFLLSLIIATIFMSNAKGAYTSACAFTSKLAGAKKGPELLLVARDTIRNVVKGVLFVAFIQAFLCYLGFQFMGIPGAMIFAFLVMLAAIIQMPVTLVVLPTVFLAFSISDSTIAATIFSIYIILMSLLDNVLKPILLAKGLQTPMVLIMLGALGGVLLHGIIGLFIGTVLLSVLHQLYTLWVNAKEEIAITD